MSVIRHMRGRGERKQMMFPENDWRKPLQCFKVAYVITITNIFLISKGHPNKLHIPPALPSLHQLTDPLMFTTIRVVMCSPSKHSRSAFFLVLLRLGPWKETQKSHHCHIGRIQQAIPTTWNLNLQSDFYVCTCILWLWVFTSTAWHS